MIAVLVRDRPRAAVVADMIDGVVAANRLTGDDAAELRDRLWEAVTDLIAESGLDASPTPRIQTIRAA